MRLLVFLCGVHMCAGMVGRWDVFSTKTAYSWATNPRDPSTNDANHRVVDNRLCKAVHVGMVVRHGARYPSDSATKKIANMKKKLMDLSTNYIQSEAKSWTNPFTPELASKLAPEGEVELKGLGRRTGIRFQGLMGSNGKHLKFVSSSKSRAEESSHNFYFGLVNAVMGLEPYNNEVNNSLARFYDGCVSYEKQVEDNETHFAEFTKFEKTPEFINIRKILKTKLGINASLSADEIYLLYELCSYDKYIQGVESFWCDLLTDQDRQILEYGQDLEKYYESLYGHPITSAMSCPLVSDMFHTMDKALNDSWNYDSVPQDAIDNGYLAGKFVFGHSETVVPFMAALGLYRDQEPLLASNRVAMDNRKFRSSRVSPFAANVALVLYSCDQLAQSVTDATREFMVQLYVNEKVVRIPGCQEDICPYRQVRQGYSDLIDRCNITDVCAWEEGRDIGRAATPGIDVVVFFLTFAVTLLSLLH